MIKHLNAMKITTTWDLAQANTATIRRKFNVVVEKTSRELQGVACLELEDAAPPKQESGDS
ncbi:DNA polymerase V subunit UmuC [compost metagenome]